MIKIEKKIEKIRKSCLETAKRELVVLKEENISTTNEKISKMIEDYQDILSVKYTNELNKIEREYNRNLFDYEMEGNLRLNKVKTKLFENIKAKVVEELKKFVDSKEYKKYLIKNIEETLKNSSKGTIYVTENDFKNYKDELEKLFNTNIDTIDNTNIGGCMVENNKIAIDNTIKNNIEEKLSEIKF